MRRSQRSGARSLAPWGITTSDGAVDLRFTPAEAATFLRRFSGRTQTVYTAVALSLPGADSDIRVEASAVHFRTLAEATIQAYLQRTRPLDRAGAYDIDENGYMLIADHGGSYTNIMGLPVETVADWFVARGVAVAAEGGRQA